MENIEAHCVCARGFRASRATLFQARACGKSRSLCASTRASRAIILADSILPRDEGTDTSATYGILGARSRSRWNTLPLLISVKPTLESTVLSVQAELVSRRYSEILEFAAATLGH